MLRFSLCAWGLGLALLLSSVSAQAQTTIASQGFESTAGDTWSIASGSTLISDSLGTSDSPASQRIRTGGSSWQVNNASTPATLELSAATVTGYTDVQVTLHLSATSGTSGNGVDNGDTVAVYIALDGTGFPETPDLLLTGDSNAKWGYSATSASTPAGTSAAFQPASGGDRAGKGDDYSTLVVTIPDGTETVALRVEGFNNSSDEFWNLDDLALTGTPPTTDTRVQFALEVATAAEGHAGTSDYNIEVILTNPDPSIATTATVALIGGTASASGDYLYSGTTPDEKTVTFPAGSATSQTVTVTLQGDTAPENDETLTFEIRDVSGGTNAAVGSRSQFTLTLQNDDGINAWINEFHYDNVSTDEEEFVEIAVPAGFADLANVELIHYNGDGTAANVGTIIASVQGTDLVQGTTQDGFTLYYWEPTALQNGTEGLALCYNGLPVVSGGTTQFFSYDGTFTAKKGCASGLTSTNVGETENSATPVGSSIGLTGTGDNYSAFTWTSFDQPTTGYGATKGTPNVSQSLPVELISFEAVADGSAATLSWTTASEENNTGFHVEHRRAATTDETAEAAFTALGFVEGAGTTSEASAYRFQTDALEAGRHVFRLRQVDFDGTVSYSSEVELAVASALPQGYRLSAAYPNPFNPRAAFELEVAQQQHVRVSLYDALGRRVAVLFEGVVEAGVVQEVQIEGSALASGVYLYRAEGERFQATRQVSFIK